MARYLLLPRAEADLGEIWDYSAGRWADDRAESYVRSVWHGMETVTADPRRGGECSDIRRAYFKFSVGSDVVFYRVIADGIDVVRILHQRMDFDRHL